VYGKLRLVLVDIHSHYWEYPHHFSDDFREQAKRVRGDVEVDLTVRWDEYHKTASTCERTIVFGGTIRKHPNVYADCSALHYRPFQLYHSLMLLQEYGVWNKLLFGSDYPFTTVDASLDEMRGLNKMLEGACLPRLDMNKMEEMFERDSLRLLEIA
jgi:predicted TIM-barrel fold metal-dependent hydrolase